ncbi:FAD-dependent monooxygenase [Antarctobacter sp.]|uniref:FAD-dependent monooxygenase n=1 Tax=Antarctobacter sp. TaxID=1872577 RepID=UPI003A908C81
MTSDSATQVLIVGAGPVGLGMAIELARRGINCVLVEQGDGTIAHPRTGLMAVRTMEMLRGWGLADAIKTAGFPPDYELSMVFCTALDGLLLDKEYYPGMADTPLPPEAPEHKQRCPQSWMQPILTEAAASFRSNDIRYGQTLTGFAQDETGVTAQVADTATGATSTIRADYLLACDGAGSFVRQTLGIPFEGRLLGYSINILFTAPDLAQKHAMGEAERYLLVGPEGTWGNVTVIDGRDTWRMTVLGGAEKMDLDTFDAEHWVRRALGNDRIDFTVTSVVPWRRSEMLAARFRDGRVLLAGDAAHTTSPTGGMGMNTGMQEIMDLGWKLEGDLKGWAGPGLLDSYEAERRPVAARNLSFSTTNYNAWRDVPDTSAILEDTARGVSLRKAVGARMRAATRVEWESLGLQIGHRYEGSSIVVPDGSPEPPDDFRLYQPTARPGSRAPHAWLPDGRSTLDLFGDGFVCLTFPGGEAEPLAKAFRARGVPFRVERIDDPAIAALYQRKLVLVRPDGHVGWRGNRAEAALDVVDTLRGAGGQS